MPPLDMLARTGGGSRAFPLPRNRGTARGWALVLLSALLLVGTTMPAATAAAVDPMTTQRLAGADRFATSLAMARAFADLRGGSLDTAVLVGGRSWPDAVTAAGLAGLVDGPILLVHADGLSRDAIRFLERTGVSELIAIGSEAALPLSALAAAAHIDPAVERITAADRFSASAEVARRMAASGHGFGSARTVILANGAVFADAMVAGAFAARGTHAVLLTPRDRLHPAVAAFIASDLVERVVILGGHAAISASLELNIDRLGRHVVRLAGATRFETAVAVADYLRGRYSWTAAGECFSDEVVALTTAAAPWDAFTAGPLLGRLCAPLLLSGRSAAPDATAHWIGAGTNQLIVLGGPAAVSRQAVAEIVAVRNIGARVQAESRMFALVNELRADRGLEPLRHHAGLRRVARGWSAQMPEDGPFGHNPDWIDEYPLGWHLYGENVAREYVAATLDDAVTAALEGLRNSPPHLSNMINPEFTDIGIGIGIEVGERKIMITQNFSSYPLAPVETPPAKPRLGDDRYEDRTRLRWEATTSDLPITHWEVDDGTLPGEPPTHAWGYAWHDSPDGLHRILVRACNAVGCSEPNAYTFSVGAATPAPGAPAEPALAIDVDGQSVVVRWDTGASEGDSAIEGWTYHLERHTAGSDSPQRYTHEYLPADQRQRRHRSLQPGRYTAYVLAHNAHGPGAWASADFIVTRQ